MRRRDVGADLSIGDELDALSRHQIDTTLHHGLFLELHIRNPVHQQTADAVGPLVDRYLMAGAVKLRGTSQTRRSGTDDRDALARALRRWLGHDPALGETLVDDGAFYILDRHRRSIDTHYASALTGRGADAAGKFREVIGLVQAL